MNFVHNYYKLRAMMMMSCWRGRRRGGAWRGWEGKGRVAGCWSEVCQGCGAALSPAPCLAKPGWNVALEMFSKDQSMLDLCPLGCEPSHHFLLKPKYLSLWPCSLPCFLPLAKLSSMCTNRFLFLGLCSFSLSVISSYTISKIVHILFSFL